MQPNAQTLQVLAQHLQNTLNPNRQVIQQAQAFLEQHEKTAGFPLCLLTLIKGQTTPLPVRQAGAIFFKNFVKRQWDDGTVSDNDRAAIKQNLVGLMLSSPKLIRAQLAQAVGLIAKVDFFQKWPQLMPHLTQKMGDANMEVIIGVLETCASIFKEYRHAFKSVELIEKIRYVLETFAAKCWSQSLIRFWQMVAQTKGNKEAGNQVFKVLTLLSEIFYSLNSQDIPEFFEDDMKNWSQVFKGILKHVDAAQNSTTEIPSQLNELKTSVLRCMTLYNEQYESKYRPHVPDFVKFSWEMLTSLSSAVCNDDLCTTAIKYLTSVVSQTWNKNLFSNQSTLESIVSKIILPNVSLREADLNMFEMDGEGYMRKDMEGSDQYTRRRVVVDFVQALCIHFQNIVTPLLMQQVQCMMQQFQSTKNWQAKDAAMYLVLALTVQGKIGNAATQVNKFVKILPFFQQHVISELQGDVNQNPVLKADCIKFISTFRHQLAAGGANNVIQLIPILGKYLQCESYVVHTYAASTIEKLFLLRQAVQQGHRGPRPYVVPKQQAATLCPKLIVPLFQILTNPKWDSQTNPYVMKAIMRLIHRAEEGAAAVVTPILQHCKAILERVAKNPTNPQFNHYMFETISCAIRSVCKGNPGAVPQFEQVLLPMLMQLLQIETCLEFHPYAFQIMGQMLRLSSQVNNTYVKVFEMLLQAKHWTQEGNVHGICALFEDYFRKGVGNDLLDDKKLQALLGIFQQLCTKKVYDTQAFRIPSLIILYTSPQKWQKYMPPLFKIIFQRLSSKKTDMYCKNFAVFLCLYIYKHGFAQVLQVANTIQNGIWTMIVNSIILPFVIKCQDDTDRKVAVVGLTKMICDGQFLQQFGQAWVPTLKAVVEIFEIPAEDMGDDGLDALMEGGYQSKMARLRYADAEDYDPVKDVNEPRKLLGQSLAQLSAQVPGRITQMIGQMEKQHQKCIGEYLQLAGAQLR